MKKLNILDYAVLSVIVIGIGFFAFVKFYKTSVVEQSKIAKIEFKVELKSKDPYFCNLIKQDSPVSITETKPDNLIIKEVDVAPAKKMNYDLSGQRYVLADVPGKCDIIVTIEGDAVETDDDYKIGDAVIKIGSGLPVRGREYASHGHVIYVNALE